MDQLDYWQAIEDGAEFEEEPKKKKKKKKDKKKAKAEKKTVATENAAEHTSEAVSTVTTAD